MEQKDGVGISRQISATMDTSDYPDSARIEVEELAIAEHPNESQPDFLNNSNTDTHGYTSDDSQDSCHMEDATEKGHLQVRVKLTREKSINNIPSYKMTSSPRGLALIIDIEEYDNEIQDKRIGSKVCRS